VQAPTPPTLTRLKSLGAWLATVPVRFDDTLAAARSDIGPNPDPSNEAHAKRLRCWLNAWLCRIRYPRDGESDLFVTGLADWWAAYEKKLPDPTGTLAQLTDDELEDLAEAYEALRQVVVSPKRRRRYLGPTAAAKVLYFLRPLAVTAWDATIAWAFGQNRDGDAFRAHLERCRSWAKQIVAEAAAQDITETGIGKAVLRPDSSVAKLIDEYLYEVVTRKPPSLAGVLG
jgi:hypothetical protein